MNIAAALESLAKLLRLEENWDGEGSARIEPEYALLAIQVLVFLNGKKPNLPLPSIVPMRKGGVQLDWQRDGLYLEIECRDDQAEFCVCDTTDSDHAFEGTFSHDYWDVEPYLERLEVHA